MSEEKGQKRENGKNKKTNLIVKMSEEKGQKRGNGKVQVTLAGVSPSAMVFRTSRSEIAGCRPENMA
ncbi:7813_t:CDS:2 [Cetraspora pellucida]|uniref:7813_t:CDS:1 n=1 Tax=Cetraspora pellucida TaxID=1433469 RepID=A0ACA9LRM4_9GLOM|nr:7813_t:CDS:2 [Cetraspora pellucida]